jgi:hypothetical protein
MELVSPPPPILLILQQDDKARKELLERVQSQRSRERTRTGDRATDRLGEGLAGTCILRQALPT